MTHMYFSARAAYRTAISAAQILVVIDVSELRLSAHRGSTAIWRINMKISFGDETRLDRLVRAVRYSKIWSNQTLTAAVVSRTACCDDISLVLGYSAETFIAIRYIRLHSILTVSRTECRTVVKRHSTTVPLWNKLRAVSMHLLSFIYY